MGESKDILFVHIKANGDSFHSDFGLELDGFKALPDHAKLQLFLVASECIVTMMRSVGVTVTAPPNVMGKN